MFLQFLIPFFLLPFIAGTQPLSVTVEVVNPLLAASNDTVYHQRNSKLAWDQFRASPERSGIVAALTSSGFGFEAGMQYKGGHGTLNISTYCFFDKSKSWVQPDRKTEYILAHEQHHFDISCIGLRLFIQRLSAAKFTMDNYNSLLDSIYYECYDDMSKLQEQYDNETKNGQLKEKQAEWIRKIDGQLAAFAEIKCLL